MARALHGYPLVFEAPGASPTRGGGALWMCLGAGRRRSARGDGVWRRLISPTACRSQCRNSAGTRLLLRFFLRTWWLFRFVFIDPIDI
jgi:hypothetical protein